MNTSMAAASRETGLIKKEPSVILAAFKVVGRNTFELAKYLFGWPIMLSIGSHKDFFYEWGRRDFTLGKALFSLVIDVLVAVAIGVCFIPISDETNFLSVACAAFGLNAMMFPIYNVIQLCKEIVISFKEEIVNELENARHNQKRIP